MFPLMISLPCYLELLIAGFDRRLILFSDCLLGLGGVDFHRTEP